jgi:hypothetical protein
MKFVFGQAVLTIAAATLAGAADFTFTDKTKLQAVR